MKTSLKIPMDNRALKKATALLNTPNITFRGESRYAYKGWIPTLISFIQKSSGIYDAMANLQGRLPATIYVPANTTKTFQILTPKDHPFLLTDIKVSANKEKSDNGDPPIFTDTGSRFVSPYSSGSIDASESMSIQATVVTDDYALSASDFSVDADASLKNINLELQLVLGQAVNQSFIVKQTSGTGTVTLVAFAGDTIRTINGVVGATLLLTGLGTVIIRANGVSQWQVIPASMHYAWLRSLIPDDVQISIALTATSPGGKNIYGGLANVTGLSNGVATVSAEPHLERIPLSNMQYGGSGKGALKTPILFPKDGIIKIDVENNSLESGYFVNGLVNGYRITR